MQKAVTTTTTSSLLEIGEPCIPLAALAVPKAISLSTYGRCLATSSATYGKNFILVRNVFHLLSLPTLCYTATKTPSVHSVFVSIHLVYIIEGSIMMALSVIRMLSVNYSGRRMNSLSSFASSSISTMLKPHIHDTKFGSRLITSYSQPSRRFVSSTSLHPFPLTRLKRVGLVNINIHLRPCIYAQFFSTSAKSSVATSSSSAAAAKLQTRQKLKWKIIARVAYYLRVRLMLCSLFDFLHTIKFRIVYDTSCALIYLTQHLTFFFKT